MRAWLPAPSNKALKLTRQGCGQVGSEASQLSAVLSGRYGRGTGSMDRMVARAVALAFLLAACGCSQEVAPVGARFRARMPGIPVEHTSVQGAITFRSYDVQRWDCHYSVAYSDSLPGGVAPSEASLFIASTVKSWAGAVSSERALPGWPDTAVEFEARGPGELLVKGRIATVQARIYTWYVGCPESSWRSPWARHYGQLFIDSLQATP